MLATTDTAYDLGYYYQDLHATPLLSEQEKARLASVARVDCAARNRLIEGHLKLAAMIAVEECPPHLYDLLPEMVAEANLGLVETVHRYETRDIERCTPHFVAYAKHARSSTLVIPIPSATSCRARKKGTLDDLHRVQPLSLDHVMERPDTLTREKRLVAPLTSPEPAPERDPIKRAQVEQYLSYLPPHMQAVLRLRYSLSDDDERAYTSILEISRHLGLNKNTVSSAIHDGIAMLRALVEGTATIVEKNGTRRVKGVRKFKPPPLFPEQETMLMQVATRLCTQEIKVTSRLLARETSLGLHLTQAFLRAHQDELPLAVHDRATRRQERLAHIAQVCAELEAQGEYISGARLAKAAHVREEKARAFLRTRGGQT